MATHTNDLAVNLVHAVVEGPPAHFTVLDGDNQVVTTFDNTDLGGFTADENYARTMSSIFKKIAAGEL